MAVVPVAGPPKPPTPTVAVAEEGKEGQEAVQSPTDKDAEAKGEANTEGKEGGGLWGWGAVLWFWWLSLTVFRFNRFVYLTCWCECVTV